MQDSIKTKIAEATVALPKKGGQGVLVSGGLIITAAHCIDWSSEGEMAQDDLFLEEIVTSHGNLKVQPLAVEPSLDIAALGSLDPGNFYKEAVKFEEFCASTTPIAVSQNDYELFQEFAIHIYTHKGTWLRGVAQQCREDAPALQVGTDSQIENGTSGGPIVDDAGALVGIVSVSFDQNGSEKCYGMAPRPHLTLPVWICRKIFNRIEA